MAKKNNNKNCIILCAFFSPHTELGTKLPNLFYCFIFIYVAVIYFSVQLFLHIFSLSLSFVSFCFYWRLTLYCLCLISFLYFIKQGDFYLPVFTSLIVDIFSRLCIISYCIIIIYTSLSNYFSTSFTVINISLNTENKCL